MNKGTSAPSRTKDTDPRRRRSAHRTVRSVALLSGAALLLVACGSNGGSSVTNATSASKPRPTGQVLAAVNTSLGKVLVDGKAKTVYVFAADAKNRSNCYGSCAQYWPPVSAPAKVPTSVAGVSGSVGTVARKDGTKQLAIDGHPLYNYIGDTAPGATAGQGINESGGLWWVVSPGGHAIMSNAAASKDDSDDSDDSSGEGYGAG
jgi:predicted lipoprotein with Yx(FWY)xxD motif